MSTRCQLRFTDKRTDHASQVYRHSDGYPESVLTLLEHLQELLHATGTQRDASYAAAQFIFIDKLWSIERTFRCQDGIYSEANLFALRLENSLGVYEHSGEDIY